MQKLISWDSGLVPFFCWLKPGGSITKNDKLTDQVYFLYLDGIVENPRAEHHELNSKQFTARADLFLKRNFVDVSFVA